MSLNRLCVQEQAVQATRQRLDAELLVSEKPQVLL